MTREEAKALLLNISAYDIDTQRGMKKQEAIEMAIKALDQEPCDKCLYSTSEGCQYDDITETIPPFETSDDAISRQAVLDAINTDFHEDLSQLEDAVKQLPPVNQFKPICCPSMGIDCENCPAYEKKSEWEHDHEILKAYSDGASDVLDKIRAEIEQEPYVSKMEVLDILDKYKAEGSD